MPLKLLAKMEHLVKVPPISSNGGNSTAPFRITPLQLIEKNTDAGRTMEFVENFEQKVQGLTVADVNGAIKKYFDFDKLVIAVAGDFAKAEKEAE